jgi:hypothetical protein
MSRGLGETQRAVLDALAGGPLPEPTVIVAVQGTEPTRAQREAVRRAVRTLAARGQVEIERQRVNVVRLAEGNE